MFRIFSLACLLSFFSPLTAAADDTAAPLSASKVCDGRYAAAGIEILQALNYGTLYSGGDHFHYRDDVSQTVDMYRLWRGLPDWRLRGSGGGEVADEFFQTGGKVSFDWLAGNASESGKSKAEAAATVFTLDINAAVTRPADAWRDDEQTVRLSPLELWLRFVMAASDAPWANIPIFRQDDYLERGFLRLRDEALRRYQAGKGIEWAVAAQLLDPPRPSQPQETGDKGDREFSEKTAELDRIFAGWEEKVLSCVATPQEYAAWAAVAPYRKPVTERFQEYRQFLPDKLFRQWSEYWSRWSVGRILLNASPGSYRDSLIRRSHDSFFLTDIAQYIDDPDQSAWLDAGLSFSLIRSGPSFTEQDMNELLAHYKGRRIHPITAARFNLLSPEHLLRLAREGELSQNMRCSLLSAAFARFVTDGQNDKAFALIDKLLPCFPENTRKRLAAIARQDAPLAVKNALFSLYAPLISTWIFYDDILGGQGLPGINAGRGLPSWLIGFYNRDTPDVAQQIANRALDTMTATETVSDCAVKRDLPKSFVSGEKFTQDKGEWLQHPDYWKVFWTVKGYSVNFINRIMHSPHGRYAPVAPPIAPENPTPYLARYAGGNGFTHVLSVTIIRWAEAEEKKWFTKWFRSAQEKAEMAEALARVVRMNKYNDGGKLDGKPVGQRALWLLHRYYPNSEAAKNTRYWYQAKPALNW